MIGLIKEWEKRGYRQTWKSCKEKILSFVLFIVGIISVYDKLV